MSTSVSNPELKTVPVFKGPWPMGSIQYFSKDPLAFFEKYVPQYGDIFEATSIFFGRVTDFERMYVLSNPDYVKHVLQDNNRNYRKSFAYEVLKLLLGQGLVTSEGDFWRKQRRLIQPAFHRERLASFATIMTDECAEMIKRWQAQGDGAVINLSHDLMNLTLQIICKAMFSTDVNEAVDVVNDEFGIANEKLIERVKNPMKLPLWVPTPGNLREKRAYDALRGVVDAVIEKRRKSTERYDDLIAMLMEARDEDTGEGMTNEQIRDEVVTIFLAGHETTAVALTWLLHCVDEYPEVEEKLLAEENALLDGRTPTIEDLRRLEYTRMAIDETMRLYPPVWGIGRHSLNDDVIGGYLVPKNTNVFLPVYWIHRDPKYWTDPLKFIPERFNAENSKGRHRFVYFPFGGGPRQCIGNNFAIMEMQLIVPMILRQFSLHKPKGFTFVRDPLVTMRPNPLMQMQLTLRNK